VEREKRAFIEQHKLIHLAASRPLHRRMPDGIQAGMTHALVGEYQNPENQNLYTVPETTLEKLAAEVAKKLDTPVMRVVGNPRMR